MKLVNFLVRCKNENVQVELKSGHVVHGTVQAVSPTMNILLKNVKLIQNDQEPQHLEHITIRGNQVRLVVLPDELNLDSILSDPIFKSKKSSTKRVKTETTASASASSRSKAKGF
ncbi:mRNA splicing protein [Martiniozyma asiatica (nom. inval.)]|nr:mRNA splicing protein [Martiniozyma asiatica]